MSKIEVQWRGENLQIPLLIVKFIAALEVEDEHDENGPGRIVCRACNAETKMVWSAGRRSLVQEFGNLIHAPDCPRQLFRAALAPYEVACSQPEPKKNQGENQQCYDCGWHIQQCVCDEGKPAALHVDGVHLDADAYRELGKAMADALEMCLNREEFERFQNWAIPRHEDIIKAHPLTAAFMGWRANAELNAEEVAPAMTREQELACREATCSDLEEQYLSARPSLDTAAGRKTFRAGFERGWDAARLNWGEPENE